MNKQDLETVYAALAVKIDAVGTARSELFLAKLALLLANRNGNIKDVETCIDEAAASLVS